ncbi:MAG: M1 family metallopeptidase [Candidatus Jordarchaeum sp.]|uniref:M1 family metallopeptidase n=1 Tax=Candidatus Jordarchaeum sp. TaxID=2823881 RepID=UPI00404A3836
MEPLHYEIRLEPDFKSFTFRGTTVIKIRSEKSVDQIVLNANDLDLQICKVKKGDKCIECKFYCNPKTEEITIYLCEKMSDIIELTIDYVGKINDLMKGFYRSKYEQNGEVKYIAVTQFEEREARRAFPCFDHPVKKATFDIEFIVDEDLMGIANTPIIEEKKLEGGKKLIRFERTPRMSTYLLFFGVGDFEFIEDSSIRPTIRIVTTPGKTRYGNFGLQMARKSLKYGEEYTGIEFPIAKCDYIAVPDFAFGAMENWGAITFRENALLVYPGVTSKTVMARIASVIAHETAHLWFGDLVSPADWKYLWLNESFASYFTYAITDHYYPEWGMWEIFVSDLMLSGLKRDSLVETMAVELPGDREASINAASAPIIYDKGASLLRMLVGYLGEEKFKNGIQNFLNKYKFSCATSQEYWEAFQETTSEPVNEFAECWVYQAGYPIIEVKRNGNKLLLTQQTFTYITNNSNKSWLIPVNILLFLKNGETKTVSTLFRDKTTSIQIPVDTIAFKINTEQTGFYRVKYEEEMWEELGELVKEKKLSPLDSFGLENDFYTLVRRGDYTLTDYLNFLEKYFGQEDRFLPLIDISQNLMHAYLVVESQREQIRKLGRGLFENALEKIGFEPKDDDELQVSSMRDTLLWAAFSFGSQGVAQFGAEKFQELLDGKKVHADILSSILKIGAVTNEKAPDHFREKVMSADTPEIEKLLILNALGCFREKEKVLEALEFNLEHVPKKNRNQIINMACQNPAVMDYMWQWFLDNLDKLEQLHPAHFERVIISLIPVCGLYRETEVKKFFEEYMKKRETGQDTIKMALELMEVNSKLKNA